MFINEAIKTAMRNKGMTLRDMASAIGKKRPNDVSARLAHDNMSFSTAIEMLSVLGYDVIIQEKNVEKQNGQIEITSSREPAKK